MCDHDYFLVCHFVFLFLQCNVFSSIKNKNNRSTVGIRFEIIS
jgi:hypothetical protein